MSRIAILGSGAWGTAIALSLAKRGGHAINLWSRSPMVCESIRLRRENKKYLPGFVLQSEIQISCDLEASVRDAEIVVGVVPSAHVRETYERVAPFLNPRQILLSATKGIEDETYLRMTEVIRTTLASRDLELPCGVLSGPSFAQEVAAGFPTAVTVAFPDAELAVRIQNEFNSASLRLYSSDDVIGVELGGAFKNIIAIAAGMVEGLGLGHNSAAALITRGMAEMMRLAVACGGRRETLAGLSGMGDLVLTCTGSLSRNRTVGVELGRGRSLPEVLAGLGGKVAEGVQTTGAVLGLARRHGVELPIAEQMGRILYEGHLPLEAMRTLMSRPGRGE
jgi:glycerol-3-phosphate dehydrogenase (NAD(P)+)